MIHKLEGPAPEIVALERENIEWRKTFTKFWA